MHVLVKMTVLILLALLMGRMSHPILLSFAGMLMLLGFVINKQHLGITLKRVRWLLCVMLVVYVFGTPGQYIEWPLTFIRPTYEGVMLGLTQVLKMLTMLAGLSVLLSTTTRSELMSGLYQLMSLLSWTGIDPERFSCRLWLTLDYVEQQNNTPLTVSSLKDLFKQLALEDDHQATQQETIELTLMPLGLLDQLLLALVTVLIIWISWT